MAYVYSQLAVQCSTCYHLSTHGKFRLVLNFMQLHTLTLAAGSYVLLVQQMEFFLFASWV